MTNDKLLLSKAIETRDLSQLFKYNISAQWFSDDADKRVWNFVRDHFKNYSECPSMDAINANFPNYKISPAPDNILYLLDSVVADRRNNKIVTTLREAVVSLEDDKSHEGALTAMQRGLSELENEGLNGSHDLDLTENPMLRWDEYEFRKNNPGLLGLPTGFPTMDAATNGLQPGQLVVIVATPKTGKSTLALQMALNIHREHGKVPMFQSFEMTNDEQELRYDAMRSLVSHQRLETGTLDREEEARYKRLLQGLEKTTNKFWLVDSNESATLTAIASKIQTLSPDIIFIDGMYLMTDEQTGESNTPQALTGLTRSFKNLAMRLEKPIVITTQALPWKMKGGKLTADAIGYSSSFYQDADVIFGLQKEEEGIDDTRLLRILAGRKTGTAEATLEWQWAKGRFREMDATDL